MESFKTRILSQFESDIALKLLEFAEHLSSVECDVFVFMSRKFCCLYDLLLSLGVAPVQKTIVSDKILDSNTDFFKNKTVVIVDDIIICGTTIWKARNQLLDIFGAKEVFTYVFCVNNEFWVKELIEPTYKSIVLSEDRSLTFCSSIVNALSIAPRPYAIEFPHFSNIEVKNQYWQQILSAKEWNVYDISNHLQESNNISTLTFFPSVTILDELKKVFGECVFNLIDIAKIRLYNTQMNWGIKMSIVPIVTFKTLTKENIQETFNNVLCLLQSQGYNQDHIDQFKHQFVSPVCKLRFLQYSAALILASKFKFTLQDNIDKDLNFELQTLDVELLFGKWNIVAVNALSKLYLNNKTIQYASVTNIYPAILDLEITELKELITDKEVTEEFDEDTLPQDDPRNVFSDFSNIFLSLYHNKELPSREEVKIAAKEKQWDKIKKIDRLETGITWIGILEYLKTIFKYELTPTVKNVLSLVLDCSVDKGICVPVTRYNVETNRIFRAYRHGEDVKFAEEETELCGLAIEKAQQVMDMPSVPKLFLEKLLVLFIKIGVTRGVLQLQYGTTGQEGIAKIGFYLQGAVVKLKKRNSYNAESNIWLSKHLIEKKVIKSTGDKKRYSFFKHYPAIQISSSSRTEAQKFGHLLGILYRGYSENGVTHRLDDDDLVFLSTCFRPRDLAAALLVELEFYIDDLLPMLEGFKSLLEPIDHKILVNNRGYIALNSLHKKTAGSFSRGAQKAIEKGRRILGKINEYAILDWDGYWTSLEILKREDEETVFNGLIDQMATVGHRILFYVNLVDVIIVKRKNPEDIIDAVDKLKRYANRARLIDKDFLSHSEEQLVINLQTHIATNFREFDDAKTLTYIHKKLGGFNHELSKLTATVSSRLDEFEQRGDGTISYDYVVYYDIVDSRANKRINVQKEVEDYRAKVKKTKSFINDIVTQMQKKAIEEKDELYCWNGDTSSTNDSKYIFLSSSKQGFNIRRIREFVDRLFNLSDDDISFRIVISPATVFYSHLFKRFQRTEVEGEKYWEHFSSIQQKFKELEAENSSYKNLILFIGNDISTIQSEKFEFSRKIWSGLIETSVAASFFKTNAELWTK